MFAGKTERAPGRPPRGVDPGAFAFGRGFRHLRMAVETMRHFAPCEARVFRPLRRATKGSAFGNRDFLKKSSKTLILGRYIIM